MRFVMAGLLAATLALGLGLTRRFPERADLAIASGPDPTSLDPALASTIADARVLAGLFEGLLALDPVTLAVQPALAAELPTVSEGGRRWSFRLRPHLTWSDGIPLDAHALRWSWLRLLDPATAARQADLLFPVRGARAYQAGKASAAEVGLSVPDPLRFVVELEEPLPWFDRIVTQFPLAPVPRHVIAEHGDAWTRPEHHVGNGPFRLQEVVLRDRVRLQRNERWRAAASVRYETLDFLAMESPTAMLNAWMAGRVDIATDVPPAAVPELRRRFGVGSNPAFAPSPRLGTFFLRINVTRPPYDDARVRRALSLAIDRSALVEGVTRAGERAARSHVPPGLAGYEPPATLHCDVPRARELLRKALAERGLTPQSLPIQELIHGSDPVERSLAELLQSRFAQLGLRFRLLNLDAQSLRAAVRNLDYSVARASWIGDFPDPSNFLVQFVGGAGGNRTGWADDRYDAWLDPAALAKLSREERALRYAKAEAHLLQEAPIIPLYHYASRALVSPRVRGFRRNPLEWNPPGGLSLRSDEGGR